LTPLFLDLIMSVLKCKNTVWCDIMSGEIN